MGDTGRYKALALSPNHLTLVLLDGAVMPAVKVCGGLPEGARFVRGFYAPTDEVILLVFEHESWPEVPSGPAWELPRLPPVEFEVLTLDDEASAKAVARLLAGKR